ncbi:DUF3558 domain-containing protein [Streptomyces sp. 3MP-14]|uniref:DUF3558 domain-containing protein n=1 Tax=Streptomyces mimosae TaxID=2586635 RepID=A0A5N6A4J7_9ACTN|nr:MULTISPECIES: DUF3558 domain-containing protein [Streptomyces]KAB8163355.1 DUF3558 domain-containing protein [Streptomyces mimosae]KAB8174632.1 DUF3558 domain-containing protein [Streptomyces sp. 3MP-14]
MRWPSRLAVALGAMALLAGCSSGGTIGPSGDDPGDGAEATAGTDREAPPEEGAEEPVAQAGYDECQLFQPAELAELLGIPTLHITGRSIGPQAQGGRLAGCGYYAEDVPGFSGLWVHLVAGAEEGEFFAPFDGSDTGPVEGLGDRAEVLALTAPGGAVRSRELRAIDDDLGLVVSYTYDEAPGGMPAIPDAELGEAVATIAFTALERAPEELVIPDGEPEGPCAEVDLAHAAEVIGERPAAVRTVLNDAGGLRCDFAGDEASLGVVVYTDPTFVANWAPPAEEINAPEIADGARLDTSQGYLESRVISGDRVLVVSAAYTEAVGAPAEPGARESELVAAVAEAVGG